MFDIYVCKCVHEWNVLFMFVVWIDYKIQLINTQALLKNSAYAGYVCFEAWLLV